MLPERERQQYLASLTDEQAAQLLYDWHFWARSNQLAPTTAWHVWLVLAGRGFGKTRIGAESVRWVVERGLFGRIALVAETAGDARDVMVEGESGLLAVSPPWFRPKYEPSKRRVTWPNGAIATTYSADDPDQLRGPQHDFAWSDEIAKWRYREAWDNLMFGLRLGNDPKAVATTTPKPVPLIRELLAEPETAVTRGSTYENRGNLAPAFFRKIIRKYEGTRLGRQELLAELLDDTPGALWKRADIERTRVRVAPPLLRIVVAIDPAATSDEGADETGIVVAGVGMCSCTGEPERHGFVLDDLSQIATPHGWASAAVEAYRQHQADRIVAEINNGGEMVEHTIRTVDPSVAYSGVHASRGKQTRAEPISALYEQGKIHHVGAFPDLEDQMCTWVPGLPGLDSPDRMDALVWAFTDLGIAEYSDFAAEVIAAPQPRIGQGDF